MGFALILLLALQDARPVNLREMSLRQAAATKPMPEYPRASVAKKTTGVAVVTVAVGANGNVEKVDILEAPDDAIAGSVRNAVMRWTVPWKTGPDGEAARPRTGKLTFYFRIAGGVGRVFNPEDLEGGPAPPAAPRAPTPPPPRPAAAPGSVSSASAKTISLDDLRRLAAATRPTVLDIGTREDFRRAHLDGAVNIPVDELAVRGGIELPAGKPVAIDCTRDEQWRCQAAASSLGQRGFPVSIVLR